MNYFSFFPKLPSEYNTSADPHPISDLPNISATAKISTKVVQKKVSCKKADKSARKLGQKKVTTQNSIWIKKKIISEKVGGRKTTTSSKPVRRPRRNIKKVNYADDKLDDNEQSSSKSLPIEDKGRK